MSLPPPSTLRDSPLSTGSGSHPIDSVFKFAPFSNYDTEIRTDVNPSGEGGIAGCRHHLPRETRVAGAFLHRLLYQPFLLPGFDSWRSRHDLSPLRSPAPLTAFHLARRGGDLWRPEPQGAERRIRDGLQLSAEDIPARRSVNSAIISAVSRIDVEYQYYNLGPLRRESQFRVALSLANVGTFGNLKPRELMTY